MSHPQPLIGPHFIAFPWHLGKCNSVYHIGSMLDVTCVASPYLPPAPGQSLSKPMTSHKIKNVITQKKLRYLKKKGGRGVVDRGREMF